jgi:peroxiredoxin
VYGIWCHSAFAQEIEIQYPLLVDSHLKGAVARAYDVYLERKESINRALFVIDEQGTIRWSQAYLGLVSPGVDSACALRSP